jgi:prepilin-type N-terminal cleavage/methylation domain-containing protein
MFKNDLGFKNAAFTLAEVLITLGIIGIVASMTIPTLMNNIQEAQYRTALKKEYSILSQAIQQAKYDNGGTLYGFFNITDTSGTGIKNALKPYFSYIKECEAGGTCFPSSYSNLSKTSYNVWGNAAGFILKDGSSITFKTPSLSSYYDCKWYITDNLSICAYAPVDVNGPTKGPNQIGKDIYSFWILPNGQVLPEGTWQDGRADNSSFICDTSSTTTSGTTCTAKYLYN